MCDYQCPGHYTLSCHLYKHDVSETGLCLRVHMEPTQLGPIDRFGDRLPLSMGPSDWVPLETETEFSLRNVVILNKNRTMDNVRNDSVILPSSQN
jgi:hypothetical protein